MKKSFYTFIGFVFLVTLSCLVFAEEMPVPANLQAVMFQKIFSFDNALAGLDQVNILMVYSGKAPDVAGDLKAEFEKVNIDCMIEDIAKLSEKIGEASVVYVLPGVDGESVKAVCAEKGVLSISGLPKLVEDGSVAVGLGTEGGKPKIMVNLNQLKAEGHQLSADLLKLAKVIK